MTVDAPLTPTCMVQFREVESGEGGDGSRRFNLSVADESGRALVHVDDLQIVPQTAKKGSCRYLRPVWESASCRRESRPLRTVLLITDAAKLRDSLQNRLVSPGTRCVSVAPGSTFAQVEQLT